jgi:TolB-like protein
MPKLPRALFARFIALSVAIWALGCTGAAPSTQALPADVPALEAEVARHPDDAAASLRLLKAYYAAGRFAEARQTAATTLRLRPQDDEADVYLGLSYEGLARFDSARAVYSALLASQPRKALHHLLVGRLAIVTREELVADARHAVASESLLASTPADPHTVAVMPFHYVGSDSTFQPLERGLAALVVTDLSRVHELRVVERARLQALLDELKLAESGRLDPATGARSGRLLSAGQVVEGQFATEPASQVRIDATVVRAADAQVAASGSNADQLQALFDVEKTVVLQLLSQLGIALTPAESVAISERPTRDIEAFLLYSRGLEATDRGDFTAAAAAFSAAARRDPSFGAATQQAAASEAAEAASATAPADLATAAGGSATVAPPGPSLGLGALTAAINAAVPSGATLLAAVASSGALALPVSDPNRICEGATCDGPARAVLVGSVTIIFKLP